MRGEESETIQYRIVLSKEPVPQAGDVLHACGLTNWHVEVLRIEKTFPGHGDGSIDVQMRVQRRGIGKEYRPCPICGVAWMAGNGAE